ncbi:hypothetical protein O181_042286 [Austropuccinia psidii MF-1]|uniref:Uncharacterized protein n=1 Tax=Austropuccinia psidii MF-1 TaxID=1389203 RepID=A0A9Q3HF04_9BASI|nr:hypothetical protein [Austropuccinia psidii MF-1]
MQDVCDGNNSGRRCGPAGSGSPSQRSFLSQRQSQKICIEFLSIEVLWPSRDTYHQSLIFEQHYHENLKSTLHSPSKLESSSDIFDSPVRVIDIFPIPLFDLVSIFVTISKNACD